MILNAKDVNMKDGNFIFYALQHRRTHLSPWLKPNDKLTKVEDKEDEEWAFSSWDVFGLTAEPWHGRGNEYRPKFKKSHNETFDVYINTTYHGWLSLKYAIKGLKRVQKADTKGKFYCRSSYGYHEQAVRHEFRLVEVVISKKTKKVAL